MSQTPSSKDSEFPSDGQIDIGPGGVIIDSHNPANRTFLEEIEKTPALSPLELHKLAVSYQKVASNSGLGNRLAFIALDIIFQSPLMQQIQQDHTALLQSLDAECSWVDQLKCFADSSGPCCGPTATTVKRTRHGGLDLIIEVTQVEKSKTYAILGVSPSRLEEK